MNFNLYPKDSIDRNNNNIGARINNDAKLHHII